MIAKLRFYDLREVIKLNANKLHLTAFGVYMIGYNLERLEWAIATINDAAQLAPHLGALRHYEQIRFFEEIGLEAKYFHDLLSGYAGQLVPDNIKTNLRDARARWATIAAERLQDLYLVTPVTRIDSKHLIQGISAFFDQKHYSLLEKIEVMDLNEACGCLLIGSATAAEHIALRASESLLRRWYEHKTGKKLVRATWGTVLLKLAKEYPENERPKEIVVLGYLKQRRDEVAHPDRISTMTEAEATMMNVCSLIENIEPVLTELALSAEPQIQPPIPDLETSDTESEMA